MAPNNFNRTDGFRRTHSFNDAITLLHGQKKEKLIEYQAESPNKAACGEFFFFFNRHYNPELGFGLLN
jgi:hypothetical protein